MAAINSTFNDINRGMSEMFAGMGGMFANQVKVLNEAAPHNVLAKMGAGSGTFSAKMTTSELDNRNIFGG